jgi:hypothetical protein
MSDPLVITALVFALLALVFLWLAVRARRHEHKRYRRMAAHGTLCLLMLVTALLFATLTLSTWGYRALTREELVLVITTRRTAPQRFDALVEFPDGGMEVYPLAGDEFYVDARILKFRPVANLLGLHTQYELDRISGRYTTLDDERTEPRTLYPLSSTEPIDLFALRRNHPWLAPLVDAEYGSATFTPIEDEARFEVRLSTTGLLVRRAPTQQSPQKP